MSRWGKACRARAAANKARWLRPFVPDPPHVWRIDGPDDAGSRWFRTCVGGDACPHTGRLGYRCNAVGSATVGAPRREREHLVNLDEWPALAALLDT